MAETDDYDTIFFRLDRFIDVPPRGKVRKEIGHLTVHEREMDTSWLCTA
jgi:hypothetical protein